MDVSFLQLLEDSFNKAERPAIFLDLPGRKIFQLGDSVFKYGIDVSVQEADAMRFVASTLPDIPVPKVLQVIRVNDTTIIETRMIKGTLLQKSWPGLSDEEKRGIANQMRAIIDMLRTLESPYIGSCSHGPVMDMRRAVARGGPFDSETDFNAFLLSNVVPRTPQIHRRMLQSVMSTEHKIVFTHGDLSPRNIIVMGGKIVGLLDWENAGFYPESWEFVQFFRAIDSSTDWHEFTDDIFSTTYPIAYIIDQFLGRLTKH